MSIFSKPLSRLEQADLLELLEDRAVENARLEFKSEVPNKDETLKKLSSFANTFGGFMVIGAKANSADGRIEALPGGDVQDGYKQKVVDWCFGGANPPLTVEVSDPIPAPGGGSKACYVAHAAESDVAPHFLNGRRGVWVRTDEFSSRFEARLANEAELAHLLDRRKAILDRRAELLARARKRLATYTGGHRVPRFEICFCPRFPARPLCEQGGLRSLVRNTQFYWRQVMFPLLNKGAISQHESEIVFEPTGVSSIFEANVWGMLFYSTQINESYGGGPAGIHPYRLSGYLLIFIRHAAALLQQLGYSGPIAVDAGLSGILKAQWLHPSGGTGYTVRAGSELDDEVSFSIETISESLHETPEQIGADILRYMFFAVNWPEMVDTSTKIQGLLGWGHKFNE